MAQSVQPPSDTPTDKNGVLKSESEEKNPIATPAKTQAEDAIALLKSDHRKVEQLFKSFDQANAPNQKTALAKQICTELIVHTMLEEEIFYPACKQKGKEDQLNEAQVEHDSAKLLIFEFLFGGEPDEQFYDAKMKVLSEEIKHHVAEEEKPSEGLFAQAQKNGVNTSELAEKLRTRKTELMQLAQADELPLPRLRSFHSANRRQKFMENDMTRQGMMDRERDDHGRFASDDHDRRGRSRYDDEDRRGSSSRYEDDDRRGRGWFGDSEGHAQAARARFDDRRSDRDDDDRRSGNRGRDEDGRFASRNRSDDDDDRRGGGYRSRSRDEDGRFAARGRYDDDDRGSSRGRNEDDRYASRSRYEDDRRSDRARDEEGRFTSGSRSRYEDDRARGQSSQDRNRDEYGRFMSDDDDNRGRSRASRRDDDDERGGSRSRASNNRSRDENGRFASDEDDNRGRSRPSRRDDDDDRRSSQSSSSSHGGWFGDSKGHAEAARRGWEDRR